MKITIKDGIKFAIGWKIGVFISDFVLRTTIEIAKYFSEANKVDVQPDSTEEKE